jgi:hypothetical protein
LLRRKDQRENANKQKEFFFLSSEPIRREFSPSSVWRTKLAYFKKSELPLRRKAMAIPDHQISDLKSFETVTTKQYQVAGLYFFYKLDCLVDLAHEVTHDFFERPELFTDLGAIAPTVAQLHARYGCEESFLNKQQRTAIYSALFGMSVSTDSPAGEEGNFPNLRDELLEACATFVETKFGDAPSLRENVRQKHRLFKEYLTGLKGSSVSWSRDGALANLTEKVSYLILRNKGVSAVYGIATPPRDAWPYTFDSNGDKLIEKISKQLISPENSAAMHSNDKAQIHKQTSREEITNLQRAAIEGAKAIATAIDVDEASNDNDVDLFIRKCYTWSTSLRNLMNYPRAYSKTFLPQTPEKARGGIAVAQPLAG